MIIVFSAVALYVLFGVFVETPTVQPATRRRIVYRLIAMSLSLGVVAIGIIFAIIGVYWPSAPELSMCNAQVMWKDTMNMIINSVTSGKATVESEILISLYNPNRFGGTINAINGDIFYKSIPVGSISINEMDLVSGAVSDSIGVITFNGFEQISDMYYDFNVNHHLMLEFDLFLNLNVAGYNVNTGVPKFQMNINDPPPQKFCKCNYTAPDSFDGGNPPSNTIAHFEFI